MQEYTEPHFDDEQTLRAARPVVPLEKINAKVRHRRIALLSGAFAIAIMLGAASALLAFYVKLRSAPQVTAEVSEQEPEEAEPEPVVMADSVPSETPVPEDENAEHSEADVTLPSETPKRESAVRRRTVASRDTAEHHDERRDTRRLSEEDELQRIREAVLYDQWQERRARRATRRERRRAERYNDRDLSNLNEIFEGRGRRRP